MSNQCLSGTFRDLAGAILNATRLLAILCLWRACAAMTAAKRAATRIRQATDALVPLLEDVNTLSSELAAPCARLHPLERGFP